MSKKVKKYKLVPAPHGRFRIKALIDIPAAGVRRGDLGGTVCGRHNLSDTGSCWIAPDASVKGQARVMDSAQIRGNAHVDGSARVSGCATVADNALVTGNALVKDYARVDDMASVDHNAEVREGAHIRDRASVGGSAQITGYTVLQGRTRVAGGDVISRACQVLFIEGLKYKLTITPTRVYGGCRTFTHKEFAALTRYKCHDGSWTPAQLAHYKAALKYYKTMQKVYKKRKG